MQLVWLIAENRENYGAEFCEKCSVFVKKNTNWCAALQQLKKLVWNLCGINAVNIIANKNT
jgi:hypothetical protein